MPVITHSLKTELKKRKNMKNKNYIFTFIAFLICLNVFGKDKLITIYLNDCGFCHTLLYETYQDENVKGKLNNYKHQLFEANSKEGKEFIENYKITTFPTQIAISNNEITILDGYLEPNKQIEFLNNPKKYKTELQKAESSVPFYQEPILTEFDVAYLCRAINMANSSRKDPYTHFMKVIGMVIKKRNLKIENPTKFAFDNLKRLVCTNTDTIRMRDTNTILKYALDSANYDFIRSAILLKENGRNVCNPYIDFNRIEIIDGEEETLIQFIDKLLNDSRMGGFHYFHAIKDIRGLITGCRNYKEENKKFSLDFNNNKTETELRKKRLEYAEKFSEGLAVFRYKDVNSSSYYEYTDKYGYINKDGEIVIPLNYTYAYPFKNGKAKVASKRKNHIEAYGEIINFYINKKGECIEGCE